MPGASAAARGGERSVKLGGQSRRRRVLTIWRGGGAGVRVSDKRLPFFAVYCNRGGLTLRSNSGLCPERSRNGSSFLKSQRERRQRQRKKERGGGERDAHKPSSAGGGIITSPPVTRETQEVARSGFGPSKPEPINFKSWGIIQIKMCRSFILLCLREPKVVSL